MALRRRLLPLMKTSLKGFNSELREAHVENTALEKAKVVMGTGMDLDKALDGEGTGKDKVISKGYRSTLSAKNSLEYEGVFVFWDGLSWRFISKHREFFAGNPRLSVMVRQKLLYSFINS